MAKHIFKYENEAAYVADTSRPAGENVASSVGATARYDAVNIMIDFDSPGKTAGDAAYYDMVLHKKVAIKGDTLDVAKLDTDRYKNLNSTFLGHIFGKDVWVDDRQLPAEKYATGDEWKLSGFDLTQAGSAEVTFKYNSATGDYVENLVLTWNAGDDISVIRNQISAAAGIKSYCFPFAIDETSFGVTIDGYSTAMGLELVTGDITVERTYQGYQARYYPNLPYSTNVLRRNNKGSSSVYVQKEKTAEYYATSGAEPTADVTLDSDFVKKTAFFTSEYCSDLRDMFCADPDNPTDQEYVDYIYTSIDKCKDFRYPTARSTNYRFAFGDNADNSKTLALVSHVRSDGQTIFDFPNAHSAHLDGTTIAGEVTGFEPGTGHLGGLGEAAILYQQITKAKTDPINATIGKKGGTQVAYNTTTRLAFQSSSGYAWVFGGTYGYLHYGNPRYFAFAVRVFRAF